MVSYLQAGFVCRFIAARWGSSKLVELLRGFAEDRSTPENIQSVLGLETEELDEGFDAFMRESLGPALDGLPRWRRNLKAALESAREGEWDAVIDPAVKAMEDYPQFVGSGNSYVLLATAYDRSGDREGAMEQLRAYERLGGRQPETLKKLAGWLEEAGRSEEAAYTYEGLLYNSPQDQEVRARLGEFESVIALDPLDRAAAEYNLAKAYVKIGDLEEARVHVLNALERAPTFRPALQLLLQVKR